MYNVTSPFELPIIGVLDADMRAGMIFDMSLSFSSTAQVVIRPSAPLRLAAAKAVVQAAAESGKAVDEALVQYYTSRVIARDCLDVAADHFDFTASLLVEPSAGDGSFSSVMPRGSIAIDVQPRGPGIMVADFLSIEIESSMPIITVGNPPFGRSCELAIRFFNHAATFSDGIALVVPRTFRKAAILRKLDRRFHLVREVTLTRDAFLFRGKPFDVPAIFQIWERRSALRDLPRTETSHPDFTVVDFEDADFALQRVGANAGQIHSNFDLKKSSHYFIRANVAGVEATLVALRSEFAAVAGNTAGNPSLAMSEIVALYREQTEGVPPFWRLGVQATDLPRGPFK